MPGEWAATPSCAPRSGGSLSRDARVSGNATSRLQIARACVRRRNRAAHGAGMSGIVRETVRRMDAAPGAPMDGFTAFSRTIPDVAAPSALRFDARRARSRE